MGAILTQYGFQNGCQNDAVYNDVWTTRDHNQKIIPCLSVSNKAKIWMTKRIEVNRINFHKPILPFLFYVFFEFSLCILPLHSTVLLILNFFSCFFSSSNPKIIFFLWLITSRSLLYVKCPIQHKIWVMIKTVETEPAAATIYIYFHSFLANRSKLLLYLHIFKEFEIEFPAFWLQFCWFSQINKFEIII